MSLSWVFCAFKNIFRVGFETNVSFAVELFEIFLGSFEFSFQEIGIDIDIAVDFDVKGFDKVSEVDFDPGLFDRGLDFGNFYLESFQIGDLFIK